MTESDAAAGGEAVLSADELAGVLELFGALAESEFVRAVREAAFRDGREVTEDGIADRVNAAAESFHVVRVEPDAVPGVVDGLGDAEAAYVAGPRAWPEEPAHGEDLPHILDVDARDVDRAALARRVRQQLRAAVEHAAARSDAERLHEVVDVTYDVEAWADVDLPDTRGLADGALANLE
ncbi:hypothetical protein [Halorubellus sp. PRR65]|uniref:DUF7109 family protein n=1 Tax=Halorubellus sp. PRR65 TaxID=3098148 RepID=UPI002B261DDD|nr:hypothetical protein [Halorubellus sp. PRR65]